MKRYSGQLIATKTDPDHDGEFAVMDVYEASEGDALLREARQEILDRQAYDNVPDSITDDLITRINEAIGESDE